MLLSLSAGGLTFHAKTVDFGHLKVNAALVSSEHLKVVRVPPGMS